MHLLKTALKPEEERESANKTATKKGTALTLENDEKIYKSFLSLLKSFKQLKAASILVNKSGIIDM